jgi:ATP-binding cassette subfamily C protein CydD
MEMITAFDREATEKAVRRLGLLSKKWSTGIALLSSLRFAAAVASGLQLIFIADLLSGMVMKNARTNHFVFVLVYLSLAAAGKMCCNYLADRKAATLVEKIRVEIRRDMLSTIIRGGIPFQNQNLFGSISLSFTNQADALAPYFTRWLPQMILCKVLPMVILLYIAFVNYVCGLFLLLTAPAIPVFMIIIGKGTATKSREQWQTLSRMGGDFLDRLRGVTTFYLFGQLKTQSQNVRQTSRLYGNAVFDVLRIAFLSSAVLEFFTAVIIAGAAICIGLNMLHYITIGPAASFTLQNGLVILLLIPEFFLSLKTLGNYYHDRSQAIGAVMVLTESGFLEETAPETSPIISKAPKTWRPVPTNQPALPPAIVFDKVSFSYNGKRNILNAFDLLIRPGEKIKICGINGSGKTTLLSLLLGWYTPDQGQIRLGDNALEEYEGSEIFRLMTWIGQRATIFAGTIRANILMGTTLDDEQLWEKVLEPASLANYIRQLPSGLDTVLAEDGKSISGGERQKIALARALVKRTPILLLDEPLSHLDDASSTELLKTLDKIASNKTIVLAGHGAPYRDLQGYREIKLHVATE